MKQISRKENEWFALGKAAFSSVKWALSPKDPTLRDALRVLSVVRKLHEGGYQRIRVRTGWSPSGFHWRCWLTTADSVKTDGWSPKTYSYTNVFQYSSAEGAQMFGWKDATGKSPTELAKLFVERFPEIAERGKGRDQAYADWFSGIMATAEAGRLPVFFADYEIDLSGVSVPPPPTAKV